MDDSFTLTLSENSSVLETQYFPPIELSPNKIYALGLVEFITQNSIPNVDIGQNKFYADKDEIIIPRLGFKPQILKANKVHQSDSPVSIIRVNSLRIECNVTTGAYINDRKVHTIHEFLPIVPAGYKIVEVPSHVIYLPFAVKTIDHIQLRIIDQDGNLVNFRGETKTLRLHINSL